jgi:hypothetical protein
VTAEMATSSASTTSTATATTMITAPVDMVMIAFVDIVWLDNSPTAAGADPRTEDVGSPW